MVLFLWACLYFWESACMYKYKLTEYFCVDHSWSYLPTYLISTVDCARHGKMCTCIFRAGMVCNYSNHFRANVWEIEPFQPNFCRKIKYIRYTRLAKNAFKGSETYIWKTDRVLKFSFFDVRFTFKCQKLHFITEYIIHSKWVQIKLNYGIIKCKNNQLTLVYP